MKKYIFFFLCFFVLCFTSCIDYIFTYYEICFELVNYNGEMSEDGVILTIDEIKDSISEYNKVYPCDMVRLKENHGVLVGVYSESGMGPKQFDISDAELTEQEFNWLYQIINGKGKFRIGERYISYTKDDVTEITTDTDMYRRYKIVLDYNNAK